MSEESSLPGHMLGAFVVGAIAGAAVALLFAPASGVETRRKLAEKAREGGEKARGVVSKAREFVEQQRENLGAAVERGREVYDKESKETA